MVDKEINNLIDEFINYIEIDKNQDKKKFWSISLKEFYKILKFG